MLHDIADSIGHALPGQLAEERETTTDPVWQHVTPSGDSPTGTCPTESAIHACWLQAWRICATAQQQISQIRPACCISIVIPQSALQVNYKNVMKEYNLGPNGGILTSLNLFATRFDQVPASVLHARPTRQQTTCQCCSIFSASLPAEDVGWQTLLLDHDKLCLSFIPDHFPEPYQ